MLARRPDGAPPTESYLETRFVHMLRRAGLAAPEGQLEIRDATGGLIGRVDFRRDNILIERDGREYHDRSESFVKDRDRWTRLQAGLLTHRCDRRPRGAEARVDVRTALKNPSATAYRVMATRIQAGS